MRIILDDTGQPQAVLRETPPTPGDANAVDLDVPEWLARLIAEAFAAGRLSYDGQQLKVGSTDISHMAAQASLTYADAQALLDKLSLLPGPVAQVLRTLLSLMLDVLVAYGKVRL